MIERYSREEMIAIWTEQAQFDAWLDVELAACWAWSQIGVIPQKDVDTLQNDKTREQEENCNDHLNLHYESAHTL